VCAFDTRLRVEKSAFEQLFVTPFRFAKGVVEPEIPLQRQAKDRFNCEWCDCDATREGGLTLS